MVQLFETVPQQCIVSAGHDKEIYKDVSQRLRYVFAKLHVRHASGNPVLFWTRHNGISECQIYHILVPADMSWHTGCFPHSSFGPSPLEGPAASDHRPVYCDIVFPLFQGIPCYLAPYLQHVIDFSTDNTRRDHLLAVSAQSDVWITVTRRSKFRGWSCPTAIDLSTAPFLHNSFTALIGTAEEAADCFNTGTVNIDVFQETGGCSRFRGDGSTCRQKKRLRQDSGKSRSKIFRNKWLMIACLGGDRREQSSANNAATQGGGRCCCCVWEKG